MTIRTPCDAGVVQGSPPSPHAPASAERWVLLASILGSSMSFIDGTVVNLALPALQSTLHATAADVQWVVESYTLTLAALLLLGGALGDQAGRRRTFVVGIALFAIASGACGFAPDIEWLIAARAVQGVGAALLVPGSLALISATIASDRRGRAIGTWSGWSAATAGVGPVLGGWLIQAASWRWLFWLNLPIAALTLAISLRKVPESRAPGASRGLDGWGAALVTAGLGGLVFGLIEAPRRGLGDPLILAGLGGGVLLLAGFLLAEGRVSYPMVPLDLFGSSTFAGANLLTFFLYAALGGVFYFLPFDFIQVRRYSATAAGAALLPFLVLMFGLSRSTGRLVDRYGARVPLIVGPLITGVGFGLLGLSGKEGSYWTTLFPGIVVMGLGMAVSVAPLTTTVMGAVDSSHTGLASGINNAVSRAAGLLAVAAFGALAALRFDSVLMQRLSELRVSSQVRQLLASEKGRLAGATIPPSLPQHLQSVLRDAIDVSFVEAFQLVMLLAAVLAVAGSVSAWGLIGTKSTQKTQRTWRS
jgi:EmrB/QacA subfamily drug resistance transporter